MELEFPVKLRANANLMAGVKLFTRGAFVVDNT